MNSEIKYLINAFKNTLIPSKKAEKQAKINKIHDWLEQQLEEFEKELIRLKNSPQDHNKNVKTNSFEIGPDNTKTSFFGIDLDFDTITRKDLAVLRPILSKIHKTCEENDVSINLEGFDLLPRVGTTSKFVYIGNPFPDTKKECSFIITFDVGSKYNYTKNPFGLGNGNEIIRNTTQAKKNKI